MDTITSRNGPRVARSIGGAGDDFLLPIHLGAQFPGVGFAEYREAAYRNRRGVHQDHVRHAFRMAQRVLQGKHRAPGVPEQCGRFQVKAPPHCVEIVEVGSEGDILGRHIISRSPAPPLVVIDEAEGGRQPVQIGQEIAVVEIGPAMKDDDGTALPDFASIERRLSGRNAAFARGRCL